MYYRLTSMQKGNLIRYLEPTNTDVGIGISREMSGAAKIDFRMLFLIWIEVNARPVGEFRRWTLNFSTDEQTVKCELWTRQFLLLSNKVVKEYRKRRRFTRGFDTVKAVKISGAPFTLSVWMRFGRRATDRNIVSFFPKHRLRIEMSVWFYPWCVKTAEFKLEIDFFGGAHTIALIHGKAMNE